MLQSFNFCIDTGDYNKGTVYLPNERTDNLPVIIYCHGWGGNRSHNPSTRALLNKVLRLNIAMVTFDFYGCGETDGDYRRMTYSRWKNNLSDVLSWIQCQSWANKDKVGCFAISSGTTAALRFAQEDYGLAFIVSVATCISTNIGMEKGGPCKKLVDNLKELLNGESADLFGTDFGIDFYLDTIGKAPIYNMQDVKSPVYFLQGGTDNIYRRADAKMGYELMIRHNLPSYYLEIMSGDHSLDNVPEECANRVIDWLYELNIISV